MNKMKYLGRRDGRNVNDRDDTHSALWARNDRSQIVRRSHLNTSFYSWTVPNVTVYDGARKHLYIKKNASRSSSSGIVSDALFL